MSNALSPTQQFPQQTIELGSNPTQLNGSIGVGINGLELPANSEPASLHRLAIANLSLESQTLEQTALTSSPLWSQPWQEIALTSPLADATATGSHIDALLPQNSANGSQPLVGILDTGFDLSRSGLPGESQIYLGYDWVEGDRNPLVTDHSSTSHGNQVLEAFSQAASSNAPASIWLGRAVGSGDWAASLVEFVATAQALGHPNAVANLSFDLTEVQADGSIIPRNNLSENEIAALEFARQQGIIVVAASGNNNADLSALAQAAQQFDNVLTVGAAEQAGLDINRASYSNYGEGLSLLAEVPGNLAGSPQGTSLAATQVTQAVQTLWQRHSHLSYSQVTNLLESSATDLQAPGWDNETGHGLLNLDQALRDASQQSTVQDGIASSQIEAPFLATAPNPWDFTSNNPQHLERALALDVAQVTPGDGTTNIDTQASIRVQFASEAIDPNSLTSDSFQLVDDDGTAIAASIGSDITGGVISLTPQGPLDPFSTYSIVITADLLNDQGEAATPFSTSFTTGAQGSSPAGLRFNNQAALSGESRFGVSSIAVGPDGNVYASDITGNVLRYNLDPSTGLATSTDTVFAQSGAQIVGIAFDPNATATDLQLWITYAEQDNSGFSGTISKLALPAVSGGTTTKQDYITGLPNSIGLPHQPNGIAFGSDGKLYQTVGGVATLGGTANWGVDESPLSAAVIVADVNSANFPTNQTGSAVDVQTVGLDTDGDPTTENYDPAAANAPVQLFATGLRNAYDLAWHSNGNLYSGINQNSIGGSVFTPQSPDGSVPAINARPNEMLALIQEGNYYGHPNPSRGEYVLNGGNPTAGVDPREVTEYPVGVEPDPDFDSSLIYDTRSIGGTSPNGLTEYTGPGSLNGRLLVSFFSGARTIQSFELGADGLVAATEALQDTNGNNLQFNSPLDVAVHPSGRIYVADFGFAQSNPNGGNVRVLTPLAEASVIITPSNGSTDVSEAGITDSYTVALATQPNGPVTIAITPDGELTSDITNLIFTPTSWNSPQTVTVSAVDDSDIEGQHSGSISHSITSGSGDYGTGLAIASLTTTITDNDNLPPAAGVEIVETNGNTTVTEGGNSDSLSIRLTAAPTDNVVLSLIPDGQLDLGPANSGTVDLTFTTTNWNQAQSITINAVDDSLVEGSHSGEINYDIASADEEYETLVIAPTTVEITDNNVPGVQILPTDGDTIVTEGGPQDSYEIVLTARPRGNVNIDLAFDNSQLASTTSRVIFTPANWNIPKVVQVQAIDDTLLEGTTLSTISHIVSSGDSNFDGLTAADLDVTIADSLPPGVQILPTDGDTIVTEGGPQDSYEIVLTARPISNVNIDLALDSSQLTSNTSRVIFTPANWNLPQVVQVQAIDDALTEDTALSTISHVVSSGDSNFDGLDAADLDVVVVDNDLSNGGNALFVAGSSGLSGSDAIARDLLISKGYSVTVVDDDFSQTSDANGQNLILISQTVQSTKVNTKFTNTAVPIIVWESFLYDDLGMANGFGFIPSGSSITLTNSSHPLSGGLPTGNTPIYSGSGSLGWGDPTNNNAISIAHTGNPNQLAVFGYEQGVTMDGLVAPEKRIGLSFWENPDNQGNNEALLDAAIDWAIS